MNKKEKDYKKELDEANEKITRLKAMVTQELAIIGTTKEKMNKYKFEILTQRDMLIKEKCKNSELRKKIHNLKKAAYKTTETPKPVYIKEMTPEFVEIEKNGGQITEEKDQIQRKSLDYKKESDKENEITFRMEE